ncbi:MAG: hypothetical protein ISQ90_11265 [Rhodospirillales bacterium]|nr:hypothetical protein [Rhodospirillales bacterium]
MERRLAAILISDVVNYTKLLEENTESTVAAWSQARDQIIEPIILKVDGRIVKFTGDGFLAEFNTVQTALECAIEIQNKLSDNPLKFRMAVNMGDIIDDGRDIHGEGINIAARLESIAEPGGICISGDVFNQVRNRIKAEYEDLGPQEVKNVSNPVQAYKVKFDVTDKKSGNGKKTVSNAKPTLAVLPFDNMSSDTEMEYFVDGITEDIITTVSKLEFLNVIARNTVFVYKGRSPDIIQVGKDLNARYVVEGSVRKSGNRARVNVQLINSIDGGHLWAEKFDKDVEDIFDLQDQIVDEVFKGLQPAILAAQRNLALTIPEEDMGTWELSHRANWHFQKQEKEDFKEAIRFADMAIEQDANNAIAWAVKGLAGDTSDFLGYTDENLDNIAFLKKAIDLNPQSALCHAYLAQIYSARGESESAIDGYKRSLKLNPDLQFGLMGIGWVLVFSDKYTEGKVYLDKAIFLSDKSPITGRVHIALSMAYYAEENYIEALKNINRAVQMSTNFPAKMMRAVIMNKIGNAGKAESLVNEFKEEYPNISVKSWWNKWQIGWQMRQDFEAELVKLGFL